jgi:hypothetical protein
MLEFLVNSKARRRLLLLLWSEGASGTTAELADRAGVGFASAYRELQAMRKLDLVVYVRRGKATVFSANRQHPLAEHLMAILSTSTASETRNDQATRERVAALGAPVLVRKPRKTDRPVEQVLIDGVALAHKDPALARSLPVAFYRQRDQVDGDRLAQFARERSEKAALGFYLELTADLSGDRRFRTWAQQLRDRRRSRREPFFYTLAGTILARARPRSNEPLARRWGFSVGMSVDDFRSLFDKVKRASRSRHWSSVIAPRWPTPSEIPLGSSRTSCWASMSSSARSGAKTPGVVSERGSAERVALVPEVLNRQHRNRTEPPGAPAKLAGKSNLQVRARQALNRRQTSNKANVVELARFEWAGIEYESS